MSKKSYKDALIEVIINCKGNPYSLSELQSLRLSKVTEIHDSLVLLKTVKKMDSQEMMLYHEMQWH